MMLPRTISALLVFLTGTAAFATPFTPAEKRAAVWVLRQKLNAKIDLWTPRAQAREDMARSLSSTIRKIGPLSAVKEHGGAHELTGEHGRIELVPAGGQVSLKLRHKIGRTHGVQRETLTTYEIRGNGEVERLQTIQVNSSGGLLTLGAVHKPPMVWPAPESSAR